MIDEKKLQAIKNFAHHKFLRTEDALDFIQNVCEAYLRDRKATLKQLHIDELRTHRGDRRKNKKYRNKIPQFAYVEFHDYMLSIKPPEYIKNKDAAARLNKLYRLHRMAIILVEWWGFTFYELGYLFGITESGAALLYKRAVKEIQNID